MFGGLVVDEDVVGVLGVGDYELVVIEFDCGVVVRDVRVVDNEVV